MFDAAIPVLAVTEITEVFFEYFLCSAEMIARSNRDLPVPSRSMHQEHDAYMQNGDVPAAPVKNTLFPSSTTICSTRVCSELRATRSVGDFSFFEEEGHAT